MLMTATTTWGITSAQFLTGYSVLCATAAIAIWWQWREAIGRGERGGDPPELGVYELALLGGGPQLAITSALTHLHGAKLLRVRRREGTLKVCGALDATADPVERAVFDAVRNVPGVSTTALRSELSGHEVLSSMSARLTEGGLMLAEEQAARLRRLWLLGALLVAVGVARIAAGLQNDAAVGWTVAIALVVAFATFLLLRWRPLATKRGLDALSRAQTEHEHLRSRPAAGEGAMTVALFGGGALWLADPTMAWALGAPREEESSGGVWGFNRGGGGGAGGGGSCASAGDSSGGGGGCGGGGCGGGGN